MSESPLVHSKSVWFVCMYCEPHRHVVREPCLYVYMSVCPYVCIHLTVTRGLHDIVGQAWARTWSSCMHMNVIRINVTETSGHRIRHKNSAKWIYRIFGYSLVFFVFFVVFFVFFLFFFVHFFNGINLLVLGIGNSRYPNTGQQPYTNTRV